MVIVRLKERQHRLVVDVLHLHASLAFEQAQLALGLGLLTRRTAHPVLLQGRVVPQAAFTL